MTATAVAFPMMGRSPCLLALLAGLAVAVVAQPPPLPEPQPRVVRKKKWCCKTELPFDPLNGEYASCDGELTWIGGSRLVGAAPPPLSDPHVLGLIGTTVLTNGAFALPLARAARRGLAFEVRGARDRMEGDVTSGIRMERLNHDEVM